MQLIYMTIALAIGTITCQQPVIELENIQNKLNEILKKFSENAPSVEEVLDAARKKCEKNGGEDAFNQLMVAKEEMQQCLESNFNFTQIEAWLAEKRKTGSMDDVFAKFCKKRSIIEACVQILTTVIEPCLENVEKSSLKLLLNFTNNLVDFGCYKDGDRIEMFLAEDGLECIKSKSEALEDCAHRISSNFSLTALPLFVINEEGCDNYLKFQSCVLGVLETCEEHTPANLVDAMFKYVSRSTPCKNHKAPTSALGAQQWC